MNTRNTFHIFLATLTMGSAHAALFLSTGDNDPATPSGQGPQGANANYLAYQTPHENTTTGQSTTFNGISFSEGGLAGAYDVGVGFTWDNTANRNTQKQAFADRPNNSGFPEFWRSWVGLDSRLGEQWFELNLSGLEAEQAFTFTSYNADPHDQGSTFTVNQTPTSSETAVSPFSFTRLGNTSPDPWTANAYSFDVTSDIDGNLDIRFSIDTGSFLGLNGFDLVAVPEPSTGLLALLGSSALLLRRRRA